MRHASVQQLSAFVDGALVGVSRELVTRHLASCASCRERHAAWVANDEALRRVLSWEPGERVLEEWSSRIEMTITAERKGLPRPEFTEQLHPVISPAPEVDVERLNSAVQSARAVRRGEPVPEPEPVRQQAPVVPAVLAPAQPAPPVPAPPVPAPPVPALAKAEKLNGKQKRQPKQEQAARQSALEAKREVAPPQAGAAPATVTPAPTPVAPTPPAAPPVFATNESAPVPVRAPQPEPAARAQAQASGVIPPWSEIELSSGERWSEPPRASRVMRAFERAGRSGSAPARDQVRARYWRLRRRAVERPVLAAAIVVLLLVLAGSPLAPEVIRIPLPDRWAWRLPRIEFVRRAGDREPPTVAQDPRARLATLVATEPEIVKPAPIPAPVETTATAEPATPAVPATIDTIAATQKPVAQSSLSIIEPRPAPPKRAKPKKKPAPPEPEPDPLTWPESPGTIVPTRVTTSVVTSATPTPAPSQPTPAPLPVESEADWPLLCGTVVDGAGVPFEGALVVLPVQTLSVRTDRRGRFCVACPPGSQPIRVEAEGQEIVRRTVELGPGAVEIRITLTPQ